MAAFKTYLVTLVFMIFTVQYCSSLNCSGCHYELGMDCSRDKLSTWGYQTCIGVYYDVCVKINSVNGTTLERGCGNKEVCNKNPRCYSCKKDFCNSSTSLTPLCVIAIIAAAIIKFY